MFQLKYKGALAVTYGSMLFEGALNAVIVATMVLLGQHFGRDVTEISMLVSLKGIGTMLVLYSSGRLSDKFGRKNVIFIGLLFFLVFVIGMLFTTNFYLAMLFALLCGIGHGLMDAPAMSILFDVFGNKTGPALSIVQVFFSGGGVLTTLFASMIINQGWSFKLLFYGYAAVAIVLGIIILTSEYPPLAKHNKTATQRITYTYKPSIYREGLLLAICTLLSASLGSINYTWLPTYGVVVKGFSEGTAVRLLTAYQIGAVVGSFCFAYLLKKIHSSVLMIANPLLGSLMLGLSLFTKNDGLVFFFIFMTGLLLGVYFSLCINMGGELFFEHSGSATGAIGTVSMVGNTLMVMLSGKLLPKIGVTNVFLSASIGLLLLVMIASYFRYVYSKLKPSFRR